MLEIDFSGPHALLPNEDKLPYLLAAPAAWTPGIYLWTFLYNQAHRVNLIGVAQDSVAARHTEHITAFLAGDRTVYRAADLEAGTLTPVYTPAGDRSTFIAEFAQAMQHLSALRVFYAPYDGPQSMRERIARAIAAHFHRLGGKAVAWLDNDPVQYDADAYDDPVTLRIGRPAFIASLPDEMHL
jgi:hypothetical protein